MTQRKTFLILTLLFSLLFILLLLAGSYLISIQSKQYGVALFLFAFGAAFGQIGSLAMYIRCVARDKAMQQMLQQNPSNPSSDI